MFKYSFIDLIFLNLLFKYLIILYLYHLISFNKDNNLSSTNLHDLFLKQTKYKLKKSHSKDFFEVLWNL